MWSNLECEAVIGFVVSLKKTKGDQISSQCCDILVIQNNTLSQLNSLPNLKALQEK